MCACVESSRRLAVARAKRRTSGQDPIAMSQTGNTPSSKKHHLSRISASGPSRSRDRRHTNVQRRRIPCCIEVRDPIRTPTQGAITHLVSHVASCHGLASSHRGVTGVWLATSCQPARRPRRTLGAAISTCIHGSVHSKETRLR